MPVRRALKILTIVVASILVVGYLAAIVMLRVREADLVFAREAAITYPAPADSLRLPFRLISIPTEDRVRLSAWIVPAAQPDSNGMWILLCHGQTGNLATTTRPEYYADARTTGVNILAFDWRGFGTSTGAPS